ncbi:MAG: hypothetical protein AAFX50_26435, partial [Acidobacteriota bacterium]
MNTLPASSSRRITTSTRKIGSPVRRSTTRPAAEPPKVKPIFFELDKKQTALHEKTGLSGERYQVISRDIAADVDLFREENI